MATAMKHALALAALLAATAAQAAEVNLVSPEHDGSFINVAGQPFPSPSQRGPARAGRKIENTSLLC
jgi:hypothetical protein